MPRITYFQRNEPLPDTAMGTAAALLPQDEATAIVRLAALLTRHHENQWPGEHSAVIEPRDGTRPALVTEHDRRITIARGMLLATAEHRDYHPHELAKVREAVIHHTQHPH